MQPREINLTDLVHECGNPAFVEEALAERCPGFRLTGFVFDEEGPTVADLICLFEERGAA